MKVHEIGILFNYEIFHGPDASWGDIESSSKSGGFLDKAGDFFGGLFGKDDKDDEEEEDESSDRDNGSDDEGAENLLELETYMATELWSNVLGDKDMTWDDDGECMGLKIEDDTRQRALIATEKQEEDVNAFERYLEETEEDQVNGLDEAMKSQESFSGTKLLGLTYEPPDVVNPDGECNLLPESLQLWLFMFADFLPS